MLYTSFSYFVFFCILLAKGETESLSAIEYHNAFREDGTLNVYFSLLKNKKTRKIDDTSCADHSCKNLFSVLLDDETTKVDASKFVFVDEVGADTLLLVDRSIKSKEDWSEIQKKLLSYIQNLSEKDRLVFGSFSKNLQLEPNWDLSLTETERRIQKQEHDGKTTESHPFRNTLGALKSLPRNNKRLVNVLVIVDGTDASKADKDKYEPQLRRYCRSEDIPLQILSLYIPPHQGFWGIIGGALGMGKEKELLALKTLSHHMHMHREFVRKTRLVSVLPKKSDVEFFTFSLSHLSSAYPYHQQIQNPNKRAQKKKEKAMVDISVVMGMILILVSVCALVYFWFPNMPSTKEGTSQPKNQKKPKKDLSDFKRSHKLRKASLRIFEQECSIPFLIGEQKFLIGSNEECDVRIHDETVSSMHAEIYVHNNQYFIQDLSSTNGTFVDGHQLKPNTPVILDKECKFVLAQIPIYFYFIQS